MTDHLNLIIANFVNWIASPAHHTTATKWTTASFQSDVHAAWQSWTRFHSSKINQKYFKASLFVQVLLFFLADLLRMLCLYFCSLSLPVFSAIVRAIISKWRKHGAVINLPEVIPRVHRKVIWEVTEDPKRRSKKLQVSFSSVNVCGYDYTIRKICCLRSCLMD